MALSYGRRIGDGGVEIHERGGCVVLEEGRGVVGGEGGESGCVAVTWHRVWVGDEAMSRTIKSRGG